MCVTRGRPATVSLTSAILSTGMRPECGCPSSAGWVREMYAWDIGVAAHDLNILCEGHPETTLISQPPHDLFPYNATMYHYTWGIIVKDKAGIEVWKFDKRFYTGMREEARLYFGSAGLGPLNSLSIEDLCICLSMFSCSL